jgi:hypothetical protein
MKTMNTKTVQLDLAATLTDKVNAILIDHFNKEDTLVPAFLYNRIREAIQAVLAESKPQFRLRSGNKEVLVTVSQGGNGQGIEICPEGYGYANSYDGEGSPILLEVWDGKLKLHVWGDINKQDPTHQIDLEGALESSRRK